MLRARTKAWKSPRILFEQAYRKRENLDEESLDGGMGENVFVIMCFHLNEIFLVSSFYIPSRRSATLEFISRVLIL